MLSIASVTADEVPAIRLACSDLQREFRKANPRTPTRAWLLYFTIVGDRPARGRAEALRVLNRIGLSFGGITVWGDCLAGNEDPDWLELTTDRQEPLIQELIDRQRPPIT